MQVNNDSGFNVNSQPQMPEPARGERWAGFEGYAVDILRSMREAGFSEEEIAARRLHRELGSRTDMETVRRNFLYQRANGTGDRAAGTFRMGPPPAEHLARTENILLELLGSAQNESDELHRNHWIRTLESLLTDTRNMLSGGSSVSTTI